MQHLTAPTSFQIEHSKLGTSAEASGAAARLRENGAVGPLEQLEEPLLDALPAALAEQREFLVLLSDGEQLLLVLQLVGDRLPQQTELVCAAWLQLTLRVPSAYV